jgi:hypothetical protein
MSANDGVLVPEDVSEVCWIRVYETSTKRNLRTFIEAESDEHQRIISPAALDNLIVNPRQLTDRKGPGLYFNTDVTTPGGSSASGINRPVGGTAVDRARTQIIPGVNIREPLVRAASATPKSSPQAVSQILATAQSKAASVAVPLVPTEPTEPPPAHLLQQATQQPRPPKAVSVPLGKSVSGLIGFVARILPSPLLG